MEPITDLLKTTDSSASEQQIFACLERGGTVVTGNARTARVLRRAYASRQKELGKRAWRSPAIDDWESWTSGLWKQHLAAAPDGPLLLSLLQERSIWKRICGYEGRRAESMATTAASAWRMLSDYQAHSERKYRWSSRSTPDAELFRQWAAAFEQHCRQNNWASRSDLPELLMGSLENSTLSLPTDLLMVGFDQVSPARQAFCDAAQRWNTKVSFAEAWPFKPNATFVRAIDLLDELATCAWWAKRRLEANPFARIAVIVSRIEETRGELDRTFRRILAPDRVGIESDAPSPYEFSLGQPLDTVPVVKAAMLTLRWLAFPLEEAAASWLLTSGFLTAAEEDFTELANFDAEVRKYARLPPMISLDALVSFKPRHTSATSSRLLFRLRELRSMAQRHGVDQRTRPVSEWVEFADSALRQAHWPGARTLHGVEYQTLDRWARFTSDLAALGFDGNRVDYQTFLALIEHYGRETIFSPQSRDAPVQIMGVLESAGLQFDAVWCMGADDRSWPRPSEYHPLLPPTLQRTKAMPHTDAESDWQLTLRVTGRIAASAPDCFFSFSSGGKAGPLFPSALIQEACGADLTHTTAEQLRNDLNVPERQVHRRTALVVEEDSTVPWPREHKAGGADILRRQSACPFQAFASRRLGADAIEVAERGLGPRDRGTILHAVLEKVWSPANPPELLLQGREDLSIAKASGRLDLIVAHHLDEVLEQQPNLTRDTPWSRQYQQMERTRLQTILHQWFKNELDRADFSVKATEASFDAFIDGLQLTLRIDRIDKVEGGEMILDYKSGTVNTAQWDGDRPEEPQLPLYAVLERAEHLRGIVFAQVRSGAMCFKGRVEDAKLIGEKNRNSGLPKALLTKDRIEEWSVTLKGLAAQFLAGEASVSPANYPATCKYCALPGLCRINENPTSIDDDDEDDDPLLNGEENA